MKHDGYLDRPPQQTVKFGRPGTKYADDGKVDDEELGRSEQESHKGRRGLLNLLAQDLAYYSYAVKEHARSLHTPRRSDM